MTSTAAYNTYNSPVRSIAASGSASSYRSDNAALYRSGDARPYRSVRSARRAVSGMSHEIAYTDRIYARLTLAGKVIAEFTKDRIADLSSLLLLLRAMTPTRRGLAKLTIRNMTRGWRMERPLMLYPDPGCPTASVSPMPYDY